MATFELFHLSLIERDQGDFFLPRFSRAEWITRVLAEPFTFEHRNKSFHWVPKEASEGLVAGTVARVHRRVHHTPPEEGAVEVASDEWQGSLVLIDPTEHDDGQKVSFERDQTVGRPRAVLQSLLAALNATANAPYAVEPKPIFDQRSFWAWSSAHENRVRRITFDFVVPNMWHSASNLDEELRALKGIGVQRAKVTYEGPDEIEATSEIIKDGVDYASKGGGTVTAKATNGDKFTSTEQTKTVSLPTTSATLGELREAITKWSRRLLGREQDDSLAEPDWVGDDAGSDKRLLPPSSE